MNTDDLPVPLEIKFDAIIEDICFHPQKDVIAAASINGPVHIYSYSINEENHSLLTLNHHKKACRAIAFNDDGSTLYSVSKDRSLQSVDLDVGTVKHAISKAHNSAIYSLLPIDPNIVATGDEDGCLKVWDMRILKNVMEMKESEEFISDMKVEQKKRILLATSGEGTLTAFDIRKHKKIVQSELFDAEFLSLAIVKEESKVVVGDGDGNLYLFNWKEWGNISDRFPGHPQSIDCIVPVDDDIIITGSMDGCIRAVNILPNTFIGVLGEHKDFPVENLSLSRCKKFVASCSHDQCVKFWNLDGVKNAQLEPRSKQAKGKPSKVNVNKKLGSKDDFFSDLVEPSNSNDESDDASSNDESDDDSDNESEDDQISQSDKLKADLKNENDVTGNNEIINVNTSDQILNNDLDISISDSDKSVSDDDLNSESSDLESDLSQSGSDDNSDGEIPRKICKKS